MAIAIDSDQLRSWINGEQDYMQGVKLYTMYGDIKQLKDLFQQNPNPSQMLRAKLIGEMKRVYFASKSPALPKIKPETKESPASSDHFENDQPYQEERNRVMLLFKDQSDLHAKLDATESESERLPLCLRILELDKELSAGWDNLDYYKEHRQFKGKKEQPAMSPVEMIKRRNNLRTYIIREEKKNNSAKAEEYKTELKAIEEALGE